MNGEVPVAGLVRLLAHGSRLECVQAAKEMARRKDRTALSEVASILRRGESGHAREMAAWLLGELSPGTDVTIQALHETISDPDTQRAYEAKP